MTARSTSCQARSITSDEASPNGKMDREGRVYNASTEFAPDMVNLAYDFTGDGWPDVLSSLGNGTWICM